MAKTKKDIEKTTTDIDLNYNKLLDRLYMSLPSKAKEHKRFEIPTAQSIIQGKQTIWKNFVKVSKDLNRDTNLLYKFVMKRLAPLQLLLIIPL